MFKLNKKGEISITLIILVLTSMVFIAGYYNAVKINYAMDEIHGWIFWLTSVNEYGSPVPAWITALPWVGETLAEQWQLYLGQPHQLGDRRGSGGAPSRHQRGRRAGRGHRQDPRRLRPAGRRALPLFRSSR